MSAWPAATEKYVLLPRQGAARGSSAMVSAGIVEYWRAQDWLKPVIGQREGTLALSGAGRAWLRRQNSGADPFQEQHQLRTITQRSTAAGVRPVLVNETESPLGWLRSRKDGGGRPLIDEAQYQAGERLREDYWRAGMSPSITSNPGAPPPGKRMRRGAPDGAGNLTEVALAAKQRVGKAMNDVGPELSGVLLSVCCLSQGLEFAERSNGWPQRSGKVILQLALTRLARHYGLVPPAAGWGGAHKGIRAWGASGYKPTADRWK